MAGTKVCRPKANAWKADGDYSLERLLHLLGNKDPHPCKNDSQPKTLVGGSPP